MAKILSFRSKDGTPSVQHYLTDENEKLAFRTAEDGAVSLEQMSDRDLPAVLPDPKKDWSNQELADLFRVRQLLGGAGVPVDTLRGITDEGDPWFVYCHLNGDVFIHMARIDGAYVLDSPNVHRPLRGRDFNELIADFTDDALPARTRAGDGTTERRVIRLERGGKVRLHPSAMLAALIWTLFLAAEELVMLSPDEQRAEGSDLLDFGDVISADVIAQVIETDTADLAGLGVPEALRDTHHDDHPLHGAPDGLTMREAMAQQGLAMHQNAYAMGLSTIAIAMGFMSEAVLLDNQRKVLEGLQTIGFTDYVANAEPGPELEQIAGDGSDALLAMLAEFLGLDLSLNTETAETPMGRNAATPQATEEAGLLTAVVDEVPPVAPKTPQTVVRKQDDLDLAETPATPAEAAPVPQETLVAQAVAEQDSGETLNMSDLLGGSGQQMEEFQLGQTTVLASFDVTGSNVFSLADFFVHQRSTDHRAFDDQAQAFIDYIQSKDTDVGIITFGNEIIMIDRGAFRHDGAETYTFSWETDDGQVISMIGLRAEFQQFDLIA